MRRRVLLLVGATTLLVLVAFLVPLALLLRTVAADRAVQAATVQAQALSSLVATVDRATLALSVQQVDATTPYDVTVFLSDGTQLGAPSQRTPLVELGARGTSASQDVPGGREIVFAVRDAPGAAGVIRAFVPDAELTAGVSRAWLLLTGLGVGLLLISLVVADWLARSLVRSTRDLAAVSYRLAGGELTARADQQSPAELGVVAGALNELAGRIGDLLREERETIADLAHRVRTPLTALRLEAESLGNPEDAHRVEAGIDEVQRAVTQSIQHARRRGPEPDAAGSASCDAASVVGQRMAFWSTLAHDTERELTADLSPGPLPVALSRADLEASVDALVGNVFAHTPAGTAFTVRLVPREGGGAVLSVADGGPGLPADTVVRRGESGSGSTGLGLDIARRAAELSGGELTLGTSAAGGLEAMLSLGLRPPLTS
ncbi:MAG: histidine kinase [Pseudonocardia sp.]|nr:histidine kinase [Pseudonocardia sp.]